MFSSGLNPPWHEYALCVYSSLLWSHREGSSPILHSSKTQVGHVSQAAVWCSLPLDSAAWSHLKNSGCYLKINVWEFTLGRQNNHITDKEVDIELRNPQTPDFHIQLDVMKICSPPKPNLVGHLTATCWSKQRAHKPHPFLPPRSTCRTFMQNKAFLGVVSLQIN